MWIVTTDEFETITQVFEDERSARMGYQEFLMEREFSKGKYRVYLAEVKEYDGDKSEWRVSKEKKR